MTSVKAKFRASFVEGREGSICYRIIHERTVRQIGTGFRVFASEWDFARERILYETPDASRTERLRNMALCVAQDLARLECIVRRMQGERERFTADDIVAAFGRAGRTVTLFGFMRGVVEQLRSLGRIRTSEIYAATLRSFRRFRGDCDIALEAVDAELMSSYEAYLRATHVGMNTVSFYMRVLRATYNRAVDRELVVQRHPFRRVYTGIGKTVKRAVPMEIIRGLKSLDLSRKPSLDFARDMFLFSFYTRGMSFVDMAFLRKKDLRDGVLSYRRKKTGQLLSVRWERCMQEIVDKYPDATGPYLLPIIRRTECDELSQYRNASYLVNRKLKLIAPLLGLAMPLTMYVARHSWASIARYKQISLAVISEGMGHDSEATTQIYLASLDTSAVDRANNLILSDL